MTVFLIGALATLAVWLLVGPLPGGLKTGRATAALAQAWSLEQTRRLGDLAPDSLEYGLAAAGIGWRVVTFQWLRLLAGIGGALVVWSLLPGVPALVIGALLYLVPARILRERVAARGREVDRQLPVAIGRISAGLLAGGALADVLDEVAASLDIEGPNPLSAELHLTAAELRSKERSAAFQNLARRAPSLSLANLAQLLESHLESGGSRNNQVLVESAARVQHLLSARSRTQARAADALLSARIIPGVLGVMLLYLAQDPLVRTSLSALPVQLVLGLSVGAMALGYFLMRSMVRDAA